MSTWGDEARRHIQRVHRALPETATEAREKVQLVAHMGERMDLLRVIAHVEAEWRQRHGF